MKILNKFARWLGWITKSELDEILEKDYDLIELLARNIERSGNDPIWIRIQNRGAIHFRTFTPPPFSPIKHDEPLVYPQISCKNYETYDEPYYHLMFHIQMSPREIKFGNRPAVEALMGKIRDTIKDEKMSTAIIEALVANKEIWYGK